VGDPALDQDTRAGEALLPVADEDADQATVDRARQIGRVKHDIGRFSAEFETELFQTACRIRHDGLAGGSPSDEADHVDLAVGGEMSSNIRAAPDGELKHPFRQPRPVHDLDQAGDGERRIFRRLEDAAVAKGQSRRELHRREDERRVPWRDDQGNPNRLASDDGEVLPRLLVGFAGKGGGDLREETEILRCPGKVHAPALSIGRAVLQALEAGQLVRMLVHRVRDRDHHPLALASGHSPPRPMLERRPR